MAPFGFIAAATAAAIIACDAAVATVPRGGVTFPLSPITALATAAAAAAAVALTIGVVVDDSPVGGGGIGGGGGGGAMVGGGTGVLVGICSGGSSTTRM